MRIEGLIEWWCGLRRVKDHVRPGVILIWPVNTLHAPGLTAFSIEGCPWCKIIDDEVLVGLETI